MRAVVLLSGGLDSSVLLYETRDSWREAIALSVFYGQRHYREVNAAEKIAGALRVPFRRVNLDDLRPLLHGSALTDSSVPVPDGHYQEESMRATVVPARNLLLLSVAAAVAVAEGAEEVAYAAHAGDHAVYPDCRPSFIEAVGLVLRLCDYRPVLLRTPFRDWRKQDIVRRGADLGVPFDLTWSCYRGGELHCGTCGTCVERREAFELAGVPDPTRYQERKE